MRILALLCLFGCKPDVDGWAKQHLGSDGARAVANEALRWLEQHPNPPITTAQAAHCPSPRVWIEVSDCLID
jgi:hypothetical protein